MELGEKIDESCLILSNFYIMEECFEEVIIILNDLEEMDYFYVEWNLVKVYNELENFVVVKVYYE